MMGDSRRKISINSIQPMNSICIENYCNNIITTSKYNLYNFLYKSILNQFKRVTNIYFLVITIVILLQSYLYEWNNLLQGILLLLGFLLILIIAILNDGYADYKKHQNDYNTNHKIANHIDPMTMKSSSVYWKDIQVGDLLKILCNEEISADIVLLACGSSKHNNIFIELNINDIDNIANCDSINNMMHKKCVDYKSSNTFKRVSIECTEPSLNFNHFEGTLYYPNIPQAIPISSKNLIYRGSVLKNTDWVIGIVVYTGIETKLALMNQLVHKPESDTALDRLVNISLMILFITQIITSIIALTIIQLNSLMYMTLLLVNIIVSSVFLVLELSKLKHECIHKHNFSKTIDLQKLNFSQQSIRRPCKLNNSNIKSITLPTYCIELGMVKYVDSEQINHELNGDSKCFEEVFNHH